MCGKRMRVKPSKYLHELYGEKAIYTKVLVAASLRIKHKIELAIKNM